MTAIAELARITEQEEREYELVDGKWEAKEMAGLKHGEIIMRLGARLQMHIEAHDLGALYSPDTTFMIGKNQRLPDLAFVTNIRLPPEDEQYGIGHFAPDLAVEVISPNDLWEKVEEKVADYFAAGVGEVWVVSLKLRRVYGYQALTKVTILTEDDQLTSPALLPGFSCRIGDLFGKPPVNKQPDDATV